MDGGGTTTRKWEVELRLEQQPRATQDAYMDIGGRATQEQLPSNCRDVPPCSITQVIEHEEKSKSHFVFFVLWEFQDGIIQSFINTGQYHLAV